MAEDALYDDPALFAAYAGMRASDGQLNELVETPALLSLLPPLAGLRAADLGCGAGGLCRWLRQAGAAEVAGYDASARMLGLAERESMGDPAIRFRRVAIERLDPAPGSVDLVVSGLALHYVADFARVARQVAAALVPGGAFVFSVEHPIISCAERRWHEDGEGVRLHWPVDRYGEEGPRRVAWLGLDDVPRQHRTVASYVNGLLDAGLVLRRLLEPMPDDAALAAFPRLAEQRRRPPILLLRADRPAG